MNGEPGEPNGGLMLNGAQNQDVRFSNFLGGKKVHNFLENTINNQHNDKIKLILMDNRLRKFLKVMHVPKL